MVQCVLLDEQPDVIGWIHLKIAFLDVQDFVEEFANVESKAAQFIGWDGLGIFSCQYPSFSGKSIFKFVPIEFSLVGADNW